jgi:type VI secretion system VgrG family protein
LLFGGVPSGATRSERPVLTLTFEVEELPTDALQPFAVEGVEEISTLFHFEVACVVTTPKPPGPECLGRRATLVITPDGGQPRIVRGIVETMTLRAPTAYRQPILMVRIAPWLSRLRMSRRDQIYGTVDPVSVKDIIASQLAGVLQAGSLADDPDQRIFGNDLRLRYDYPKSPHVTQCEESDLDFISRLSEHWGIAYFFEQDAGSDTVVFTDDPVFVRMIDDPATLRWSPMSAAEEAPIPESIQRFEAVYEQVPNKVFLRDYNELIPKVSLLVSAEVDPDGRGYVVEYGAHYTTPEEGAFLARVRAEALRCKKIRFAGESSVARLSAGGGFMLDGHDYEEWNTRYRVISVRHSAYLPVPGVDGNRGAFGDAPTPEPGYRNSFTAMMLQNHVPFRPERRHHWPRINGLLNGRIEGSNDDSTDPHIDENGWYRVRLPFDLAGSPTGFASRWVRKAEPYGGPANGMHFPLPPGTDVILACVNGDPDRLTIVGAVPSADTPSVVTQANSNLNRILTRSGIRITFSDYPPSGSSDTR